MASDADTAMDTVDPASLTWSASDPVEPAAGSWHVVPLPDPATFSVPAAPANDSGETQAELAELLCRTHHRTEADVQQILRWSVQESSPLTHWAALADEMATLYKLSPPAAARVQCLLGEAVHASLIAAWAAKYHFLRPRPNMLDPGIDTSVIPVPHHPSYPAGHSTVAGAASAVLRHFFPQEAARFDATAEDSGISRLKAGIHYRSDHVAGLNLGQSVANELLSGADTDGAPQEYWR